MTNKEFFIERWNRDAKGTLKAVNGLPAEMEKLDYKPDPKSRSAIQILQHILPHAQHMMESLETGIFDERDGNFSSVAEAAQYYEQSSNDFIEKLSTVDEDTWNNKNIDFHVNGRKAFNGSVGNICWTILFDTVHHRGQLSTYYRSMGVRNPAIMGPTAEDIEEMMAAAAAKN